jgi:phytoene synthase
MSDSESSSVSVISDVRRHTRKSGTSFYYSFLLLPRQKREAIYSVYCFCRAVDDAVDEAGSPGDAARELKAWENLVENCYRGNPQASPGGALAETVQRFDISKQHFVDVLDGVRMDLTRNRYATFEELLPYCERVAGAVGRICVRIFGLRGEDADEYARNLGIALQLINIARDVGSDARRGRIYLPLADLERFGVTEQEILDQRYSPRFAALMAHHAQRARSYLLRADAASFNNQERWLLFPAQAMKAIYGALLDSIEKAGYDVFARRISLSRPHRFGLALGVWLGSLRFRMTSGLQRGTGGTE